MKRIFVLICIFSPCVLLAQELKLVLPIGHYLEITSVCFSPNGKRIVTTSEDNTAKIWDVASGKLLEELKGHENGVAQATFSSNGKKIVTASWDGTAKVWDVTTGNLLLNLKGHSDAVYHASFSPDGNKIITASGDSTVKVWDAKTGKVLLKLDGYVESAFSAMPAKFTPDGKKIITVSGESAVKFWDATSGKFLSETEGSVESVIAAKPSELSPDGKTAITIEGKTVQIRDVATGNVIAEMKGHTDQITAAKYSSNGKRIFTSHMFSSTKTWDSGTGNLLANLKSADDNGDKEGQFAAFSPDEKKIVTCASGSKTARIWDAITGKLLAELKGHDDDVTSAQYSSDGKKIITTSFDESAKVWDATSGKLLFSLRDNNLGLLQSAKFNSDASKIVATAFLGDANIWDATTGKLLMELDGNTQEAADAAFPAGFSGDGGKIVTAGENYKAKIWDASTGKLLATLKGHTGHIKSAEFSADGKKIITASYDKTVKIWNTVTGKIMMTLNGLKDEYFYAAEFSPDDTKIVTASKENEGKLWNAETGKLITILKGHKGSVSSAAFSPDGKKIITTSLDNTSKIWNVKTGKLIQTYFAIDSNDYLLQIPTGYYQTTPNGAKLLHYVTNDLQIISFEQLDVKYNRPDIVLEFIGSTDTALIKSYRNAYKKRIKKLGIDTTAFRDGYSIPKADFADRDKIKFEQTSRNLKLNIISTDSTYLLDRFNLWINEIPLYGQRGISLSTKNKNSFDTSVIVELSQGENRIETSITNVNGTESYRMPLLVNYTAPIKTLEKTYFIGIGIDKFSDSKYNLKYSTKDIRDLSVKLKEKYKDIIIDTLFNDNVTINSVKALKQKLLQTSVNDKVIISYSGHGMLSKEFDYFLSTYAVNFEKPEEKGLPYDELESLLDSIPARKKLMLIDACHSGEVDKDDLVRLNNSSDSLIKGFKPVAYKTGQGQLGLENSFELMQSLFVNVGKSTGATIISAAAGTQFALERNDLKNGVFTYSILEAMQQNKTMKLSELKSYVGTRVQEITKGLQRPTSRNETIAVDWEVW